MSEADSLEARVAAVESLEDPEARERSRALVAGVLALHRAGLEALATMVLGEPDGEARLRALLASPAVNTLFLLHGLHPRSPFERATEAIATCESELRGLSARVIEIREPEPGMIRVRVSREDPTRHGAAVKRVIESALLETTPDAEVILEGVEDERAIVPVSRLTERR